MKKRVLCMLLAVVLCVSLLPIAAKADNAKLVAITFDDGPNGKYTPILLDALKERNIKATFFIVGYCAAAHPELVKRAYDEGHQIANHTYNHTYFRSGTSSATITKEVQSCAELLTSITGQTDFMVRLPGGCGNNDSRIKNLIGAPIILWNVDGTNGKAGATEEQLYRNTVNTSKDGSIILLHDGHNMANVNAAIRAIDTMIAQGYEFVTVEELFRLKGVTPQNNAVYYGITNKNYADYNEAYLSSHWAYEDIKYVEEHNIMEGTGTGFVPNGTLTRSMAVTVLWRLAGKPSASGPSTFSDIRSDTWYSDAVAWAQERNVVQGIGNNLFGPDQTLTRQEFYKMLVEFAAYSGKQLSNSATPVSYTDDARIASWAKDYVNTLRCAGFSSKNDVQLFRPHDYMTRAECAEMLTWYLKQPV